MEKEDNTFLKIYFFTDCDNNVVRLGVGVDGVILFVNAELQNEKLDDGLVLNRKETERAIDFVKRALDHERKP
jgi:hypothetical protein